MRKLLFVISILFMSNSIYAQYENFGSNEIYFFGYKFIPTSWGVGQFYIIYSPNNKIKGVRSITFDSFLKQAQGLEKSDANSKSKNFFVEYNIIDSSEIISKVMASIRPLPTDPEVLKYKRNTRFYNASNFMLKKIINDLWKVRFAVYPYATASSDTLGWTMNFENDYMPTEQQFIILQSYGISRINDYVWGDNLFKLLKDITDPQWIEQYSNAGQ